MPCADLISLLQKCSQVPPMDVTNSKATGLLAGGKVIRTLGLWFAFILVGQRQTLNWPNKDIFGYKRLFASWPWRLFPKDMGSCASGYERKFGETLSKLLAKWRFFSDGITIVWNRLPTDLLTTWSIVPFKEALNQNWVFPKKRQ